MEISIDNEVLKEVQNFIENSLVQNMNNYGLSFPAMGFTLQTLLDGIDNAREQLDNAEDL